MRFLHNENVFFTQKKELQIEKGYRSLKSKLNFAMGTVQNTFVTFLDLLEIKHTQSFSNQYFNEHPHKNNLFGLSKMLSDYGVDNAATCISDKEKDITEIQTPFIAQFSGDFIAVHEVEPDNVSFIWKGKNHVLQITKFIEAWTGIVLLAESSEKSIEPEYGKHRQAEKTSHLKKITFLAACGLIAVLAFVQRVHYYNVGISILLLINFAGLYVSWLLLLKQMHVESQYADKICSLFKQKDCNSILESEAARLWGVIGWSETGFGYFLTNVLILLFNPALVTYIALINILTLPYTFWSVWYQRTKAKQWCVLCLIVQILLWAIFIIDLFYGYIQLPIPHVIADFDPQFLLRLLAFGCFYIISILGINGIVPKLNTEKTAQSLRQSLNSIKADGSVFTTLLKQQPFYETGDFDSVIRFGKPDSKLHITVLSNPYCNPCARMHKRIEDLLYQVNGEISVQYMLSSFSEALNSTNKYLISACLGGKTGSSMQILKDWFEQGKALKDDYFKEFSLDMENPEIEVEFQKHEDWKQKTHLRSTPTIIVNGYQLPDIFKIEDLRFFTDLDL